MIRGIDTAAAVLPLAEHDVNLPDAGRLIAALRQIGYTLEQAISDLVDNSVNAGAETVLIRFLHDGESIKAVVVVDDGIGMNEKQLHDAMRFGSREADDVGSLGKFGMGLKLASLSHGKSLSVFSRRSGQSCGRRWTLEGIRNDWWCERLDAGVGSDMIDRKWGPLDLSQSGTLVIWEDLDKLPSHRNGLRYTLTSLETRLRLHLGLCFHRFLENGSLRILVDQLVIDREGQGLQSEITPLNPFGYSNSGHLEYPKKMSVKLSGIGRLGIETHIWPANSDSPEYKLGRRSAARQGFYFYRNDRLIQAGGWNGLLHDETEPHSSLARVRVDLPVEYDADFGINVQKSTVLVPPVFPEVLDAVASEGCTFEDFRRDAIQAYRSANSLKKEIGPYPATGLNAQALQTLKKLYGRPSNKGGFQVRWAKLNCEEVFRIDGQKGKLLLNRDMRDWIGDEKTKLLLAMLLRSDIAGTVSRARERELQQLNQLLFGILS